MGGHSFDGNDARAVRLRDRYEATIHQHIVQENRTRAAFAFAAAFFGAYQSKVVPKHVQQSLHGMGEHVLGLAIYSERKLALRARRRRRIHDVPRANGKTTCSLNSRSEERRVGKECRTRMSKHDENERSIGIDEEKVND